MPLIKRSSKTARAVNVRRLIDEGYPPRQAVAIGYSTQRAARAHNRAGAPAIDAKGHRDAAWLAEQATRSGGGATAAGAASSHAYEAERIAKSSGSKRDLSAAAQAHDAAASAAWLVGDTTGNERHTSAMDRLWRIAARSQNAAGGKRRGARR